MFVYLGNRPRVGKDYLAGLTGVIYEGSTREQPPLPDDDIEVAKRLVTYMKEGHQRLHFANCGGTVESPSFEAFLTNTMFSGRVLGSSETVTLPNETYVSMSGRTGMTLSTDLALRSRVITLSYAAEDINGRQFSVSDLHGQVSARRAEVLGALLGLVFHWQMSGRPRGTTPYASFPEWAELVGGIMKACELGDPCLPISSTILPLDESEAAMKQLFAVMAEHHAGQAILAKGVVTVIQSHCAEAFAQFSPWRDSDRAAFSKLLRRFAGRELGNVKLEFNASEKSERSIYTFRTL